MFSFRYIDSVPSIIPLLEREHRGATRNLNEINEELRSVVSYSDKLATFLILDIVLLGGLLD